MQDAYLLWVCYAILFFCTTFCAVAMPLGKLCLQLFPLYVLGQWFLTEES
jgi:hypothetical protein